MQLNQLSKAVIFSIFVMILLTISLTAPFRGISIESQNPLSAIHNKSLAEYLFALRPETATYSATATTAPIVPQTIHHFPVIFDPLSKPSTPPQMKATRHTSNPVDTEYFFLNQDLLIF